MKMIIAMPGCSGHHSSNPVRESTSPPKIISVYTIPFSSTPYKTIRHPFESPFNVSSLIENVPMPFKKALFWPEQDKSKTKKHIKDTIPSAIPSESWQE